MPLLQVKNMTHYFGGLRAVHQYHLEIEPGQIRALIGPNGAGKTTVFNLITGIHRPSQGQVILEGENIVGQRPHQIASRGLWAPEGLPIKMYFSCHTGPNGGWRWPGRLPRNRKSCFWMNPLRG